MAPTAELSIRNATLFFSLSFLLALTPAVATAPACSTSKSMEKCMAIASTSVAACRPGNKFVVKKAECLCVAYTQLANCWAVDDACKNEWRAMKTEAGKMCSLSKKESTTSKAYRAVLRDAAAVAASVSDTNSTTPSVHAMENKQQQHRLRFHKQSRTKKKKRSLGVQDPHTLASTFLATQSAETIFEFIDLEDDDISGLKPITRDAL